MESKSLSKKGNKATELANKKPARKKASKPEYLKKKIQKKMAVSDPADSQEKEADKVAADVKQNLQRGNDEPAVAARSVSSSTPSVSRTEEDDVQAKLFREEEEEAQTKVHRKEEEVQTKIFREEEEEAAQPKLFRNIDELAQAKLYRQEEEEVAQTRLQRTEEDPVQAKLMRKERDKQRADDEKMDEVEARIAQSRGNGSPLPDEIRQKMEQQFGKDFSRVVIHTDMQSDELCKELNARAFAIGNDIYFATGEFNPDSERGQELLAHELTHVVQQNGKVSRKSKADGGAGTYTKGSGVIVFDNITVPSPHAAFYQSKVPLIRHRAFSQDNRTTKQQQTWKNDIEKTGSISKLQSVLSSHPNVASSSPQQYIFKVPSPHQQINGKSPRFAMGSLDEVARELSVPSWDTDGKSVKPKRGDRLTSYDVDHIVEEQVGSASESGKKFQMREDLDGLDNFQLLIDSKNTDKMHEVKNAVRSQVDTFKENNTEKYRNKEFSKWSTNALLGKLSVKFNSTTAGGSLSIDDKDRWTREQVKGGDHLQSLIDANEIQYLTVDQMDVKENHVWIFNSPSGGYKNEVHKTNTAGWKNKLFKPFSVTNVNFETGDASKIATLSVNVPDSNTKLKKFSSDKTIDVMSLNGSDQVGYLPMERWSQIMKLRRENKSEGATPSESSDSLEATGFSPLTLDSVDLIPDTGLVIKGQILPTLPIIGEADIGYEISGNDFTLSKTFNVSEINLPKPIETESCDLTISAGSRGFAASGRLDFTVDALGAGYLEGEIGSSGGLGLEGGFDFDSDLFDRASIKMWYREGKLGGEGEIGIDKPDKIKGIKSANVKASYDDGTFSATGEVKPALPAIEQGTLELNYSEEEGLDISGEVQIAKSPGIRSGKVNLRLRKQDENWKVSGEGTAQPDIPGIDSELTVGYEDGGFVAEFSGGFERGMLSGNVTVGVSNRAVGEDGKPSGDPLPGGELLVYGSGSATIQIAPWLQGTAGVKFDPNGEVTVSGEIGIPDELEIFARKEINKTIFQVAVQVPIIPGIVAEVGGGLSAIAGIGPGVIDELKIGIEYNPAREQDTKVTGDAHLRVPADAGLRLSVRAGIGLGITGASATGGLDIGGTLGISGAATAGVHIDWTPATGLDLTADLEVYAQPSFTFDIGGYVSVKVFGWSVYDDRFEFASYTFGSDYRFGIKLPVHYKEGEPFDISTDDIEFEIPDISTNDLLKGLISRIT